MATEPSHAASYVFLSYASADRAKAAANLALFYVPFALLFLLLREVRWTRQLLLQCLGIAVVLAVALGACSNANTPAPAPQVPEVSVITVHRGSVPITTDLPGRTSAYLVAQVRARVDGIVLKREFKEGGEVKAGQRLYQIDPAPYIAALNSATASLQKAEANLA